MELPLVVTVTLATTLLLLAQMQLVLRSLVRRRRTVVATNGCTEPAVQQQVSLVVLFL